MAFSKFLVCERRDGCKSAIRVSDIVAVEEGDKGKITKITYVAGQTRCVVWTTIPIARIIEVIRLARDEE